MVKWVFSILQNTWKYSVYADNRKLDIKFVNKYVQSFLEQFNNIDDSDVAFIYPESYTPNYFMIQALIKKEAKKDYVIENLLPDDDTINHLAIFCRDKKETIELMNHLVYSAVLGENFGGYKLLGVHLCYYLECCGNDSYAYTMRAVSYTHLDVYKRQVLKHRKKN